MPQALFADLGRPVHGWPPFGAEELSGRPFRLDRGSAAILHAEALGAALWGLGTGAPDFDPAGFRIRPDGPRGGEAGPDEAPPALPSIAGLLSGQPYRLTGPVGIRQPGEVPFALSGAAEPANAPLDARYRTTAQFSRPFLEERAELLAAMLAAEGAEAAARRLDYAQFLIAHMMLPEARGLVASVLDAGPADRTSRERALGYAAILGPLSGRPALRPLPGGWRDDPLWPLLVAPPEESGPVDGARIREAVAALGGHSRAVATGVLPSLFHLALAGGEADLAGEIIATATSATDLEGTDLLNLMRGRHALALGEDELAFDFFAWASEGRDRAAAEARLALADLALARGDRALLPRVRDLLRAGLPRWRGDETALRLHVRLARVAEDLGDVRTAVEVMSVILRDHPGTPEAELARSRLPVALGVLAERIADEGTGLEDAIATVRRLESFVSDRGGWVEIRARLAARLLDAGLAEAAQAEYAAIWAGPEAAVREAEPEVLDAIVADHARLLIGRGDGEGALAVLDRRPVPRDGERLVAHAAMRVEASGGEQLPAPLLFALDAGGAEEVDDPATQLALARAARAAGRDEGALAAYERALRSAGADERLHAARLAGEGKDGARLEHLADFLPLDRSEAYRPILDGIAAELPALDPLSADTAKGMVEAAGLAGASVEALLGGAP